MEIVKNIVRNRPKKRNNPFQYSILFVIIKSRKLNGKHLEEIAKYGFPYVALAGVTAGALALVFLNIG